MLCFQKYKENVINNRLIDVISRSMNYSIISYEISVSYPEKKGKHSKAFVYLRCFFRVSVVFFTMYNVKLKREI